MKKEPESFTYKCVKCNRLSVDTGFGERGVGKCAYCFEEDNILEQFAKKKITAGARDEAIRILKEAHHRP